MFLARLFVYLPQMKNFVSLCKGSLLALLLIFSALIIVGAQNAPTNILCASKSEKGKFTGYICDNGIEKIAKQGKFSCLALPHSTAITGNQQLCDSKTKRARGGLTQIAFAEASATKTKYRHCKEVLITSKQYKRKEYYVFALRHIII